MTAHLMQRSLAVAGTAALLAALSGCSLLGGADPEPTDDTAANDAAAAKFVACLIDQGQTAKILDGGMVGLLLPEGFADQGPGDEGTFTSNEDGGGGDGDDEQPNMTAIMKDDEGEWQSSTSAAGYPEENGMRDAWLACEEEVPEFEQPEPDMNGDGPGTVTAEEQMEVALAFADCARENGYADFPDPGESGSMALPADITEDGFRQLLEDCYDVHSQTGFMIEKETADSLDFDLMSVMQDFMEAHPEMQGPATGGQSAGPE